MLRKIPLILFLLFSINMFQFAEARRFGGGFTSGYSRSVSTKSFNKYTMSPGRVRSSTFSRVLSALSLGIIISWLFNKLGVSGFLVVLSTIGIITFLLRYRHRLSSLPTQELHRKSMFDPRRNQSYSFDEKNSKPFTQSSIVNNGMLPDGTPEAVFKSQALNLFYKLQALNNKTGLEETKIYLTKELYGSIEQHIQANQVVAEFRNINSEVIDAKKQLNEWIISVSFAGEVREDTYSKWTSFKEVWHYVRQDGEYLWKVAGIQQLQS